MGDTQNIDEQALVRAIASGDEQALGRAYDLHGRMVYSLALRILSSPPEAEEVLQDVFLQLWNGASRFDPERGRLPAWLVTITRNRSIDRLRARRARPGGQTIEGLEEQVLETSTPIAEVTREDAGGLARRALEELPPDERRVLELAYFEGLSQTQIADKLGSPLGTVKTRARNGLRRLRQALPLELLTTA